MSRVYADDIPGEELDFEAIRASGPGGQHVNKVATAIHLKFDVRRSSLPVGVKHSLLALADSRVGSDGVITIKARESRSQVRNRIAALARLDEMLAEAQFRQKPRRKTRPSRAVVKRRLDGKKRRGDVKKTRSRPQFDQ